MKRKRVDTGLEQSFLMALIMSKSFLSAAAPVLDLELIDSKLFTQVAQWCLDYLEQYGDAPKQQIESIYHAWAEDAPDDEVDSISDFLEHLSSQYDTAGDLNVPYLLDELSTFLTRRKLTRLNESIEYSLLSGDESGALVSVSEFSAVDLGVGIGIDILNDREAWKRIFSDPLEPLITFPGDAGYFLNGALTRDALIGIQGPEKRGKTFWCVEFVMRALRNRKKVALFEVGDLSEGQIMMRLGVRLSGLPMRRRDVGVLEVPTGLERAADPEEGEAEVIPTTKSKRCRKLVSRGSCVRAAKKFMRGCGIPKDKPYVKVSVHPNSSINVRGIEGVLERWRSEDDFIPDVIVIDYADILAPEDPRKQERDQVNDTWKALRRLSQERHCLVIVPTQASADSYDVKTQGMKHFSNDKRKLAHVTGMLGLNQTEGDKQVGVMRLNWIVLRESDFSSRQCLYVGQCLPLARAFCCGRLW